MQPQKEIVDAIYFKERLRGNNVSAVRFVFDASVIRTGDKLLILRFLFIILHRVVQFRLG